MVHIDAPGGHTAKLLLCFVFSAGFGGFELWRGLRAGEKKLVDAAVLEAGAAAPGVWLEVRGRALWDFAAVNHRDRDVVYFVPVVSPEWQPSRPVAVFLECRHKEEDGAPHGKSDVTGYDGTVISGRGLGIASRAYFDGKGMPRAEHHILLQPGGSPKTVIQRGWTGLALGGAALVLIPVVGWLSRRFGVPEAA